MIENINLTDYFSAPISQRQRQYEVVRSIIIDNLQVKAAACKFGYKSSTVFSLLRDAKCGKIHLFPRVKKGPLKKRTPTDVQEKIIEYRKQGFSTSDIELKLKEEGVILSARTIERILKDGGFGKLQRRTNKALGKTAKNKIIPLRSGHLDFMELEPFTADCPVAGIFFFIPYIIESGILDLLEECQLPESSNIGSTQACLSMLFLKLIGNARLSHIGAYDKEPGLGIFAGLNILRNQRICLPILADAVKCN